MRRFGLHCAPALAFFLVVFVTLTTVGTDSVFSQVPFYQGKTITLIIGAGPGGMGDLRARALASVLVKHIPGNPTISFQYTPGAGGRKAANHLYNTARADGLTLFRISSSIIPYAVLGESGVQYVSISWFTSERRNISFTISSIHVKKLVWILWRNCARLQEFASAALLWVIPGISRAA